MKFILLFAEMIVRRALFAVRDQSYYYNKEGKRSSGNARYHVRIEIATMSGPRYRLLVELINRSVNRGERLYLIYGQYEAASQKPRRSRYGWMRVRMGETTHFASRKGRSRVSRTALRILNERLQGLSALEQGVIEDALLQYVRRYITTPVPVQTVESEPQV